MAQPELEAIAAEIREHDKLVVVTHENPDGDALGSMLAMTLGLRALGKDVVMYLAGTAPTPAEYGFLELRRRQHASLPGDLGERVLIAVDCANDAADRRGPARSPKVLRCVLDIDHHHDNSRFGDVAAIVDEASSTAEIVRDLLRPARRRPDAGDRRGALRRPRHRHRPVPVHEHDPEGAAARGRARRGRRRRARRLPARLRDGAVREAEAARARARARAALRGRPARHLLPPEGRLRAVGAEEPYSEGIIDQLRSVEGSEMVALIREPPRDEGPARRISLRSSHDEVDVSAIAREAGGGGHRQAAGFSSELLDRRARRLPAPPVPARHLAPCRRGRLDPSGSRSWTSRQGPSSFALVGALRRRTRARTGHAGTLDPFATGLLRAALGRSHAARPVLRRPRQAVRDGRRPDCDDVDRRSRGRGGRAARRPGPGRARRATRAAARRGRAADPGALRRQDRRRARVPSRAPGRRGRDAGAPLAGVRARGRRQHG